MKSLYIIAIAVFSAHIVLIAWALTGSELQAYVPAKEKIVVTTVALKEPSKPKEVAVVSQQKKPSMPPKKAVPSPKKEVSARDKMIQRAKENLAKLQASRGNLNGVRQTKSSELAEVGMIESLTIDTHESGGGSNGYHGALAARLRQLLRLPEVGDVRIALTVESTGKVLDLKILSSKSEYNGRYVEATLKSARLPPFGKEFGKESKHTFTITLTNDK